MKKIHFENQEMFHNFLRKFQPEEIWWDEFSVDEPYILITHDGQRFRGCYNHQCLLAGKTDDYRWLWREGLYVKTNIKKENISIPLPK